MRQTNTIGICIAASGNRSSGDIERCSFLRGIRIYSPAACRRTVNLRVAGDINNALVSNFHAAIGAADRSSGNIYHSVGAAVKLYTRRIDGSCGKDLTALHIKCCGSGEINAYAIITGISVVTIRVRIFHDTALHRQRATEHPDNAAVGSVQIADQLHIVSHLQNNVSRRHEQLLAVQIYTLKQCHRGRGLVAAFQSRRPGFIYIRIIFAQTTLFYGRYNFLLNMAADVAFAVAVCIHMGTFADRKSAALQAVRIHAVGPRCSRCLAAFIIGVAFTEKFSDCPVCKIIENGILGTVKASSRQIHCSDKRYRIVCIFYSGHSKTVCSSLHRTAEHIYPTNNICAVCQLHLDRSIVDRRMSSDIHSAEITFDSTAIDCDLPAGNTVRRLRNIGTARSGRLTCTCTEYMAAIDNGFRAGINIQALHSYSYSACNYRLGNRK